MISPPPATGALCTLLAFNASNQLAVRRSGTKLGQAFVGADEPMALGRLEANFPEHTPPAEYFSCTVNSADCRVFFSQVRGAPTDPEVEFHTLEQLAASRASLAPSLVAVL